MLEFELVLPCYNEGRSLERLIDRAARAAEHAAQSPETFQIVIVENGSQDGSRSALAELKQGPLGRWFRVVPIDVNQGYGFGILTGLRTTTAAYVGWSHADQQCDPLDAFRALALCKLARDPRTLVKGVRLGRNWKDAAVSRIFESIARVLLGMRLVEINAQPKVFPRELLADLRDPPKDFAFDLYVLYRAARASYAFETIAVLFPPRAHGVSSWSANFIGRYKTILAMLAYMQQLAQREGRI
jgi:glycosyltransferase involved in cell wall biosynthesis